MNVNQLKWQEICRITADVVIGILLFVVLAFAVTFDGGTMGAIHRPDLAMVMLAIVFSALFAFSRGFCRHLLHLHR